MLPKYLTLSRLNLSTGGEPDRVTAWVSCTSTGDAAAFGPACHTTATGRRARVGMGRIMSLSSDELLETCVNLRRVVVVVVRPRAMEISLSWRRYEGRSRLRLVLDSYMSSSSNSSSESDMSISESMVESWENCDTMDVGRRERDGDVGAGAVVEFAVAVMFG